MELPDVDWLQRPDMASLLDVLGAAEGETRFVGGCVRDALLGLDVSDIDLATRLRPEDVPPPEDWAEAVLKIARRPEVVRRLAETGFEARPEGSEALAALVAQELPRWAEMVRAAGIEPE